MNHNLTVFTNSHIFLPIYSSIFSLVFFFSTGNVSQTPERVIHHISKQYKVRPKFSARRRNFQHLSVFGIMINTVSCTTYNTFLKNIIFTMIMARPRPKVTINLPYFCWLNSLFIQKKKEKGIMAKLRLINMCCTW